MNTDRSSAWDRGKEMERPAVRKVEYGRGVVSAGVAFLIGAVIAAPPALAQMTAPSAAGPGPMVTVINPPPAPPTEVQITPTPNISPGGGHTGISAGGVNHRDPFGLTPLHWAVQDNDPLLATELLREGANPNLRDELGQTPLHLAAMLGEIDLVEVILRESHPDLSLRDEDGMTALNWAAEGDHPRIVQMLQRGVVAGGMAMAAPRNSNHRS